MKRTVMLYKNGRRRKHKTFEASGLGFSETMWTHSHLQALLGDEYSITKVGRYFDFVDVADVDEFVCSNPRAEVVVIKVYVYEND